MRFYIDYLDKTSGTTDKINLKIRKISKNLVGKFPNDYQNYETAIEQAIAYGLMGA